MPNVYFQEKKTNQLKIHLYHEMSGLTLCKLSNVIALSNMKTNVRNHGT